MYDDYASQQIQERQQQWEQQQQQNQINQQQRQIQQMQQDQQEKLLMLTHKLFKSSIFLVVKLILLTLMLV